MNTVIQGAAADLVKQITVSVEGKLPFLLLNFVMKIMSKMRSLVISVQVNRH